ncbi:MAG: serine protease [Planctomycetota bacterium]|nr:MAG: serine protease [Planctomycetota bacterium]
MVTFASVALAAVFSCALPIHADDTAKALDVPADVLAAEARRVKVMEQARATTVAVFGQDGQGGGSGVLISADGYALSNFHVTSACGDWMKCGLADGKLYDAVIVGIDPVGDVGLIKLLGRDDFPHAELADSDAVKVGQWVFCSGNPFLLATDFKPTVTYGIVSGVGRYQYPEGTLLEYADCIQTDAAINPGNSGGPLFDAAGKVIGINGRGSFEKRGRVNVGVGYAISINQIKRFMGQLRGGRIVDHATLGATVSSDDQGRPRVDSILDDSDAYRRGLRYDDAIEILAGRRVSSANAVKNVLGSHPKGWRVPIVFRREGQRFETHVRLAGVHREAELLAMVQAATAEMQPPKKPQPEDKQPDEKKPSDEKPSDDAPDGGKEKDKDAERDEPKIPLPGPWGGAAKKPAMPEEVKRWYEARSGFANYHFNKRERDRVWKAFVSKGSFERTAPVWRVKGVLPDNSLAIFEIGESEALADLPAALSRVKFASELAATRDPPGSGGLLVALHLWQRLLRHGPERFGQVTYWGTAPVVGREDLCDVLAAVNGSVEARFYFTPNGGDLVLLEMFADDGVDPCEIAFGDYREQDGLRVPTKIDVRYGEAVFAAVSVKEWRLAPEAAK